MERDGTRARWETLDYANRPHYGISLFNGVGGIPVFLADYARLRGNEEARALALGALEWCALPEHAGWVRGLHFGKAGPAFSALLNEGALESPAVAGLVAKVDDAILNEDPGPVTDLVGGAASNGFYLLESWKVRGTSAYLDGATRCGEWLLRQLARDDSGCHCLVSPGSNMFGGHVFLGLAHGIAGVALFFTLLHEATRETAWKSAALEIFDTLERHARPVHGGWNWPGVIGEDECSRCQWSHGAPGIGMAFLKAYEIFGELRLLRAALMAGEATFAYGDLRQNATQCIGLAGCGDYLLELARVTREPRWLERANGFGRMTVAYRATLPEGDVWPTDGVGLYSPDFMYGGAGIGHFLLRLETQGELPMPLIAI